ncbi:integumentary mucin B.1-like [Pyxicephalus adspersus]|uniref:integumentary mucin B.1-like n=1 Tax=Pyxicephalus adspersus TaxID=30357 RepID=UPI003B590D4C
MIAFSFLVPGPVAPVQPTIDLRPYMTSTPAATQPLTTKHKKGCCGPSGDFVNDGESWEKGCTRCTCNGNTGKMECGPYPCANKVVCGANETLVFGEPSKQSKESCCGYCAPLTCKHNGTEYQINESFSDPADPCLVYTCHATGLIAIPTKCPKQACAEEWKRYDKKKCCYTCDTSCKPLSATISILNIKKQSSRNKIYKECSASVTVSTCGGQCQRSTRYDYESDKVMVNCKCCKAKTHYKKTIQLKCKDGSYESHTFNDVETCSCQDCSE